MPSFRVFRKLNVLILFHLIRDADEKCLEPLKTSDSRRTSSSSCKHHVIDPRDQSSVTSNDTADGNRNHLLSTGHTNNFTGRIQFTSAKRLNGQLHQSSGTNCNGEGRGGGGGVSPLKESISRRSVSISADRKCSMTPEVGMRREKNGSSPPQCVYRNSHAKNGNDAAVGNGYHGKNFSSKSLGNEDNKGNSKGRHLFDFSIFSFNNFEVSILLYFVNKKINNRVNKHKNI